MIQGFSKKKIKAKTLGSVLKLTRKKLGFSIEEAESQTKVRAKFLEALEEDNWQDLPTSVYIRGFVLAYAKFLGLNKEEALDLFNQKAQTKLTKVNNELTYKQTFKDTKFVVTPRIIGYASFSTLVVAMFVYIFYQLSNIAGAPNLKVVSPNNNTIFESEQIELKGATDTDSHLTINNENIPISNDGHFVTSLTLHRGINVIKVKAKNKAEKETIEVLTLEYKPKTALIDLERTQ